MSLLPPHASARLGAMLRRSVRRGMPLPVPPVAASLALLLLVGCTAPPRPAATGAAAHADHASAFERLQSLVGAYAIQGGKPGSPVVDYELIARRSALLERWTWPSGAQELTAFFLDNGVLRATHYCHSGIQSTMTLQDAAPGGELVFRITSATNLSSPEVAHNTGFGYRLDGDAKVVRSEEWTESGKVSHSQEVLVRRAQTDR